MTKLARNWLFRDRALRGNLEVSTAGLNDKILDALMGRSSPAPGQTFVSRISDLGLMDTSNLRGISKTAPYFHNNFAATLQDALDHYEAFFKCVARLVPAPGLPPIISTNGTTLDRGFILPEERAALIAYLLKL